MTDIMYDSSQAVTTLKSAINIPDAPLSRSESAPSSPSGSISLKRRLSDSPHGDVKKVRLSEEARSVQSDAHQRVENAGLGDGVAHALEKAPPDIGNEVTSRRHTRTDEKKRGKRLFGGLLGTLSQSSTTSAQRRRAEIDKKQQAKLKAQDEEREEDKKQRLQELATQRSIQQQLWEEQAARIRHDNKRAMANMLCTRSEPRIYYLPYELRHEDKLMLQKQREDVEANIEQGGDGFKRQQTHAGDGEAAADGHTQISQLVAVADETPKSTDQYMENVHQDEADRGQVVQSREEVDQSENSPGSGQQMTLTSGDSVEDTQADKNKADESEDVMVEAGEDSVIY